MVDYPDFQLPMRGGLMSINAKANRSFGQDFVALNEEEQKAFGSNGFPHWLLKSRKGTVFCFVAQFSCDWIFHFGSWNKD